MESSDSSSDGKYDDGVYSVYDKVEDPPSSPPSQAPKVKPPKLPTAMLVCMAILLTCCFVGILLSGLHFGHKVEEGDCLAQSCIMFSSILGLLYIALHLQAARKSEPLDRQQPCCMHPLHSSVIVVARLDTVAWVISLIIISVAVSKDPVPVSCANLAVCTAVTPAILFILCVDEKATRPFDLPYITAPSSTSVVTCRLSALLPAMPGSEVSAEDSISRRGSAHSTSSQRGNSHTQHAAAIAAANSGGSGGSLGLGGPRPPPRTANVKEPRRWGGFHTYDDRTKKELAASVVEASQASEVRTRVGGPRALALSDKAKQTGVLPPPVCLDPKHARDADKENAKEVPAESKSNGRETWRKVPENLNSTSTTPAAALGLGLHGSTRMAASRCLSPVEEVVDDRRHSIRAPAPVTALETAPAPRSYTYATSSTRLQESSSSSSNNNSNNSNRHRYDSTSVPRSAVSAPSTPPAPPASSAPSVAEAAAPPVRARMRLVRAQDALKVRGARDTVVLLNRPRRVTVDRRSVSEDQGGPAVAAAASVPVRRSRSDLLRIPGSYVDT